MSEHRPGPREIGEAEVRMALRGLRQDIDPASDLWPGIAARIERMPRQDAASLPLPHMRWRWPLAVAASMLLAVGVAWQLQPSGTPMPLGRGVAPESLVQREADNLTVQYRAALQELELEDASATWKPGLDALDRSAAEIRGALQRDPDSRLLLGHLRDTYTRRLALARRARYA